MHQSAPRTRAHLLDRDHRLVSIGMIALVALAAFEAMAVTAAMPTVADALDGLSLYPLAFALPLATGIVGMAVGGNLSDVRGPLLPLLGGVAVFAVGLLAAGAAPTMLVLTLARGFQGFGSGVLIVALYVVVARQFPTSLQPRVFAAFAGAWVIPAIVGPAIAGLIVDHLGWRWVFLSVPALAIVALGLLVPSLRSGLRTPDREAIETRAQTGVGWSIVAAVAATALHLAGQSNGLRAVAFAVAGLAGLVAAVPRLLPRGTSRMRRGLPAVVATRGIISAAFVTAEVLVLLLLNRERGLSPGHAGLALTAAAVAWSAGSWWQGRDSVSIPRWRIAQYGAISLVIGIAGSALVTVPAVPVYVALPTWALAGLGMGMVMPTVSLLTLSASRAGDEGHNSSALQISDAIASTVALAVTGTAFLALLDASGSVAYVVGFAASATLAAYGAAQAHRMAPAEEGQSA
ncbi:MFS transporter [Solicola gregarius]|uniref:MFS transporter n=1 Tax=Solicola gregarius TaxID=2908642 RepID=A0AA46TMA1_9ACTN|nr:MFS transporter [Solicola gregarius]UYM07534.1 MFS transporter [Solicola gregarius]